VVEAVAATLPGGGCYAGADVPVAAGQAG